jgi:hypothetical protein
VLIIIDLIGEKCGFWSIYETFQPMQCDKDDKSKEKDEKMNLLEDSYMNVDESTASGLSTILSEDGGNEIQYSSNKKNLAIQQGKRRR